MIKEDVPTNATGPVIVGTSGDVSWKKPLRSIVKRKELEKNEGFVDALKKGAKAVGGAIKDVAKDELEKTFGKFGSAVRKRAKNAKRWRRYDRLTEKNGAYGRDVRSAWYINREVNRSVTNRIETTSRTRRKIGSATKN